MQLKKEIYSIRCNRSDYRDCRGSITIRHRKGKSDDEIDALIDERRNDDNVACSFEYSLFQFADEPTLGSPRIQLFGNKSSFSCSVICLGWIRGCLLSQVWQVSLESLSVRYISLKLRLSLVPLDRLRPFAWRLEYPFKGFLNPYSAVLRAEATRNIPLAETKFAY